MYNNFEPFQKLTYNNKNFVHVILANTYPYLSSFKKRNNFYGIFSLYHPSYLMSS